MTQKLKENLNIITNILVPVIAALLTYYIFTFNSIREDVGIMKYQYINIKEQFQELKKDRETEMKDFKDELKEIKANTLNNTLEIHDKRVRLRKNR